MAEEGDATFTASETKLLISIIKHIDGDIKSNWDNVASDLNYKDGAIARTRWNQIKRKKIASSSITAPIPGTGGIDKKSPTKKGGVPKPKPATAKKGKEKARKIIDSEDDEEMTFGMAKGKPKAKAKVKHEEPENHEAEHVTKEIAKVKAENEDEDEVEDDEV